MMEICSWRWIKFTEYRLNWVCVFPSRMAYCLPWIIVGRDCNSYRHGREIVFRDVSCMLVRCWCVSADDDTDYSVNIQHTDTLIMRAVSYFSWLLCVWQVFFAGLPRKCLVLLLKWIHFLTSDIPRCVTPVSNSWHLLRNHFVSM